MKDIDWTVIAFIAALAAVCIILISIKDDAKVQCFKAAGSNAQAIAECKK